MKDVVSDNTTVDNTESECLRIGEQQLKVEVTSGEHKGEINSANENLNATQLFKSDMNIGRDAMGTMANTLIMIRLP